MVRSSSSAYVTCRSPQATAARSPKASAACSKRSAKFKAMGTKVERATVLGKPLPMPGTGGIAVTASAVHDTGDGQPHALIGRRGHVLIVTMNRPEARN